jgi:hypothetical protein
MPSDKYLMQLHSDIGCHPQRGYYTLCPVYREGQRTGKWVIGFHANISYQEWEVKWVKQEFEYEQLAAWLRMKGQENG